MKKFSIILNIVLIIVSLFFVIYAQLQYKEAKIQAERADKLANEAVALQGVAEREAANAREAEARALELLVQLEACQQSK